MCLGLCMGGERVWLQSLGRGTVLQGSMGGLACAQKIFGSSRGVWDRLNFRVDRPSLPIVGNDVRENDGDIGSVRFFELLLWGMDKYLISPRIVLW